jgi:hydroxymethylbilane synthase
MRLGTRGSALALAQARWVAARIGGDVELVEIATTGDADRAARDKEKWVRELDRALLDGEIDLAVHSAKDVPGRLADGVAIVGVPPREDPRDALCGAASLAALRPEAVVGTSSVRRAAQLRALRDDLVVSPLRGNVDTRLRRLAEGDLDAIVLARAGLVRLDRADAIDGDLDAFVPAAGQGALALTARARDTDAKARAMAVTDVDAATALAAERALVVALDADCDTPVGAHCTVAGGRLTLRAFVGRADGGAWLRDELSVTGTMPAALGEQVAERLRAAGADEVLGRA